MIEIISIFTSLISFSLISNFPVNNFLIRKFSSISFSFSEVLLINIFFNCNLLLLLSFFHIDLNLIFFLLVIPSIILTILFYKQYLRLLKKNIYLVILFLVIYYSISILVIRKAHLEWDGLEHWIFKSTVYFNGGEYKDLAGLPFDYYPHLGAYLWAFFWKNSILQLEYSGMLFFITPTFQFVLGLFLYNEPFDIYRLIGFILIWLAVIIYVFDLYEKN